MADGTSGVIVIDLEDSNDPCVLPPDLRSLKPARPGIYRLRSTGQEIENPDYLTTWTCKKRPPASS
ncbi:MAG TPA: hypothetical protein VFC46_11435 [Humisphaera sp.]|nr:hypothetical protein [Humisphaera sp.]